MTYFRLVAMDLDDTLLTNALEITARTKGILDRVRAKGVHVTLATGRMYRSTLPFARQLGITEALITYQGALVKNELTGAVLFYRPVPLAVARDVLRRGYELNMHMNVYVDDTLFVDSITEEGTGYANLARVEQYPVGNLLEFLRTDPVKIIFIANEKLLDNLQPQLAEIFGQELYITRSKPQYLEFMHKHANKGLALATLAAQLGVSREEIIAFGDSFNDLEMLSYAGMGVAMGNARPEIKACADYVTGDNDDDGVARALEKFVLNGGE